jgi:hypothetical protein
MPSTLIRKTCYDEASRTLSIWFMTSERRYNYLNVPPEVYTAFRHAFSKGRYFNSHIRDLYRFSVSRG